MSSRPDLKVAFCDHKAASYAVLNWHYSERMPRGRLIQIGVWEGGAFIGCVIFGRGASDSIGAPYGLTATQVCELVRVALKAHVAPVSQIMRAAMKLLKKENPGLRLIVSYADPEQNHHGGIYQATNWTYVGKTASDTRYIDEATGKEYHSRTVSPSGFKKKFGAVKPCPKTGDLLAVKVPGKHKYLYPLDRAMRKQIAPLTKPYPKREVTP